MKRTLRNIVGGLGLLTLVAGCTPAGAVLMGSRDPGARVVGTFMYHEGMHQDRMEEAREGRSQVNVYGNQEGVSYEDRRILNQIKSMPRVVCRGDVDNDGILDWYYYDGRGNESVAYKAFVDDQNNYEFGQEILDKHGVKKNKKFHIKTFIYVDGNGFSVIPESTIVIWY